jgi:hypothetical protein
MGQGSHLIGRVVVLACCLVAAAALSAAAAALAGTARSSPGSTVWKQTPSPGTSADRLLYCVTPRDGSVIAAGVTHGASDDVWVTRYSATGDLLWSRTWDGPDGLDDRPTGIAFDGAVSISVATQRTGSSCDTAVLRYGNDGSPGWARVYDLGGSDAPVGIGYEAGPGIYVAANSSGAGADQIVTAKLDRDTGSLLWTSSYGGTLGATASDLYVTYNGDLYVAGALSTGGDSSEALLLRMSYLGETVWAQTWDGPGVVDGWTHIRPDHTGVNALFVAGRTGSETSRDVAVARYTAGGDRDWVRTWGSRGGYDDTVTGLEVRDRGVWLTIGTVRSQPGDRRAEVLKLSTAGRRLFTHTLGTATSQTSLSDILTDRDGNAYACGSARRTAGGSRDAMVLKYSPAGLRQWRSWGGFKTGSAEDLAALKLSKRPFGYLFAVGQADREATDSRGLLVKVRL